MNGKKRGCMGKFIAAAGLLILAAGLWLLFLQPAGMEALWEYGAALNGKTAAQTVDSLEETLEGSGWTCCARKQHASATSEKAPDALSCTVIAVGKGYFEQNRLLLNAGRLLNDWDQENAARTAVLPERTAGRLFPGEDPVGQTFTCNGSEWQIAGTVRDGLTLGEADGDVVYIPITVSDQAAFGTGTFEIAAEPRNAEQTAVLISDLNRWNSAGTRTDLSRLRADALMPLWLCAILGGCFLLRGMTRFAEKRITGQAGRIRQDLRNDYFKKQAFRITGRALVILMNIVLWAGAFCLLLLLLIRPLYAYPDRIPENPARISSVIETVRRCLFDASSSVIIRSRASVACDIAGKIISAGLLTFLTGLAAAGITSKRRHGPDM